MKKWQCKLCGYVYDQAKGEPDHGIPPGTDWGDVPDDFYCPECGAGKDDFEMVEI
jgi:rubredoxin-NAD+ reductase